MTSHDRSSMHRIFHGYTQPVYTTTRLCDSLIHYLTQSDRTTRKLKYFDYEILVVKLGWWKSSLLHLDYARQATSNETTQIMLLMTLMDQLMHHYE